MKWTYMFSCQVIQYYNTFNINSFQAETLCMKGRFTLSSSMSNFIPLNAISKIPEQHHIAIWGDDLHLRCVNGFWQPSCLTDVLVYL